MTDTKTRRVEGFRLSPRQKEVWALQSGGRTPFRAQAMISIEGDVNPVFLHAAIEDTVRNHEILRTYFPRLPDGSPVQAILSAERPAIAEHDLSGLSPAEQQTKVAALFENLKRLPFDFEKGPLLRVCDVFLSASRRVLLVALPSICADAATLRNLAGELSRGCLARAAGEAPANGSMQFADIAEWQIDLLEGEDGEPGRQFWKQRGVGACPRLPLQGDAALPEKFEIEEVSLGVGEKLAARLAALSDRLGVSLETLALSCFYLLLWRLSGESPVVGAEFDGRAFDELDAALGLFARFLPLQIPCSRGMRFSDLVGQVSGALSAMAQWQDFYAKQPSSADEQSEIYFPYSFAFHDLPEFSSQGLTFRLEKEFVCADRFHLNLSCARRGRSLQADLQFDPAAFAKTDVQRLGGELRALLASVCDHPDGAIERLDILAPEERRYLVSDFNATYVDIPTDVYIHQVIEDVAARNPDAVAVEFQSESLTYGELNVRANQLAHKLRKMGVGPDVFVAVSLERSVEMIVAVLGILKAGGAYVPLDPAYPEERLAFMMDETRAPALLTKSRYLDRLSHLECQILCLDKEQAALAAESPENPEVALAPGNLVYVIYTSGSTGLPKGVAISHQDLMISNRARISYFDQPVEKFLLLSSLSFDSSVVGIFWTLCAGGALCLVPEDLQRNVVALTETIAARGISHLLTLPSFYSLVLEYASPGQLDCLKTAIVAGEACPLKMVERHKALLPNTALYSEYGATETTVFSSVYDCLQQTLKIAPVGGPIDNAQMYVLDADMQPAPIGVAGEVYFGGDALAECYLRRPSLTAERFLPNPFSETPGSRLYRSGDLARHLPCGDVEFLGRVDNQVKVRGYRIELEEIEAVLGQHAAVREVAVLAVDAATGKRLVAYVSVSAGTATPSGKELRNFLAERLPEYMVPALIVFLGSLPKNPNGKIDRRALPEPESAVQDSGTEGAAPASAAERKLAEIWSEVLGRSQVGVDENFFELGGDSILSIQIIARANRAGLALTPAQIFQHQTIAELAAVVGDGRNVVAEQGPVAGAAPLIPIQKWFAEKDLPNPSHFNMSMHFRLKKNPGVDRIRAVIRHLVDYHDALRLRYDPKDGFRQTHADPGQPAPVEEVDLRAVADEDLAERIAAHVAACQGSLDIERGPVVRLTYFDCGPNRPAQLLWAAHHLMMDGVSWRILLDDFQTIANQLAAGRKPRLPEKTTSFKTWAERLAKYAQSASLAAEAAFWESSLAGDIRSLPLDLPEGMAANNEASIRKVTELLTESETRDLLHEIPRAYNTQINDVLLAALGQALFEWTGERSHAIDLEGHGREDIFDDVDLSRTVGWFTIFHPVLVSAWADSDPGAALTAIKERLRSAPNHGLGYGVLRYLSEDKSLVARMRALPRPRINFNYLGQFDQILDEAHPLEFAGDVSGSDFHPDAARSHVLEIVGSVVGGRLRMEWAYSQNLHRRETIEALAQGFSSALRFLIEQCKARDRAPVAGRDFADFQWRESDLNEIAAAIEKTRSGS